MKKMIKKWKKHNETIKLFILGFFIQWLQDHKQPWNKTRVWTALIIKNDYNNKTNAMQYNAADKSLTELDEGFFFVTAHFSNMRTLKFKSHCCVFPCLNHINHDNKPGKTETQKNCKSQTITFWTCTRNKLLFPKRYSKVIDSSQECKRLLAFELQRLCVIEKPSKRLSATSLD